MSPKCRTGLSLLCRALLGGLVGCSAAVVKPVALAPDPKPVQITKAVVEPPAVSLPPYLLHLPGIGGKRSIDQNMTEGFVQGGFSGQVEIYDWTEGDIGFDSLIADSRNHKEAKLIAAKLTERYDKDPASPIYLTSHSGGGGLAVWALEDLPDRVKINTLVLMSPALSPQYDLSKALRHVSGKAYVFSSMDDQLVLGTGCRLLGTIDGVKTDAAGRVGFAKPPGADDAQYAKLVPMPFQLEWTHYGDMGNHVGGMTHRFARLILAPLVLSGKLPPEDALMPVKSKVEMMNDEVKAKVGMSDGAKSKVEMMNDERHPLLAPSTQPAHPLQ